MPFRGVGYAPLPLLDALPLLFVFVYMSVVDAELISLSVGEHGVPNAAEAGVFGLGGKVSLVCMLFVFLCFAGWGSLGGDDVVVVHLAALGLLFVALVVVVVAHVLGVAFVGWLRLRLELLSDVTVGLTSAFLTVLPLFALLLWLSVLFAPVVVFLLHFAESVD